MSQSVRKGGAPSAARVGIGGPVGSGKTALVERLIPALVQLGIDIAVITNDLVLAPFVGVALGRMTQEASTVRDGRPVLLTNCRTGEGIDAVVAHLEREVLFTL
jgi:Ni2+-binding GTPase involved in maturation of urease and hydrogenase